MTAGPGSGTIRALFALSGNVCAMPECETVLFRRGWAGVRAHVAHIRGDKPGSARFDPSMTDEERQHFDNLMVVCPNCHILIDTLERDEYGPERLRHIKTQHEERMGASRQEWASEAQLTRYVGLALVQFGWAGGVVANPGTATVEATAMDASAQAADRVPLSDEVRDPPSTSPSTFDAAEPYDAPEPYDAVSVADVGEGPSGSEVLEWLNGWFGQSSEHVSVATIAQNLQRDPEAVRLRLNELAQKGLVQVIGIPERPEDFLTVTGLTGAPRLFTLDESRLDGGNVLG